MFRTLLAVTVFASTAAFATGERVSVTGAASALKETLCISMTCVGSGPKEFVVSGRAVKGGVELTVTSANGQTRLTHLAKVNESNQIGSTDLVAATTLVIRSIEKGPIAPAAPAKVAKAAKAKKKAFFAAR
ncbi:MAG TPA: hypothetical protein VGE37_14290 [Archangium sp.]